MTPYINISNKRLDLLDYGFWHLPESSIETLFQNVKRIDLRELYATIYLNLFDKEIIDHNTEPIISNHIPIIKEYKKIKSKLTEEEKKPWRIKINSLYLKGLNNKYLLHQVLENLYNPIKNDKNIIYIDTDVIYFFDISDKYVSHLNSVYGDYASEMLISDLDYLYIIRHKLVAEKNNSLVKTNLDRLIIHRQNNVRSKVIKDNESLRETFNILIRDKKLSSLGL